MEKLKVLHLTASPFTTGGIEIFLSNMSCYMDSVQFDFLTTKLIDEDNELAVQLKLQGSKFIELNIAEKNCLFRAFQIIFKTKRVLKEKKYRIVHIHSGSISVVFYFLIAACMAAVPVKISHSHSSAQDISGIRKFFFWFMRKFITEKSDFLFACSTPAHRWMFTGTRKTPDTNIVKNGIKLERFAYKPDIHTSYRKKYGLEDKIIIGTIGRLTYPKNQEYIFAVMKKLIEKYSDILLILVGEGEEEQKLKNIVDEDNLDPYVQFWGNRNDIPELLSMIDVFLLPSRWEGLGIVNIEAQVSGVYTIVSENIPSEAIFSDLVEVLPLNGQECQWAEEIERLIKKGFDNRKSHILEAKAAGYDAEDVAFQLQKFYLKLC